MGATLTHLVVGQQEYFSIDDNSFVVTAEQTRVDNWYHQQFQFSNGQWAGMEHNYYDDVGIGRQEDSSLEKGYKLVGDVDFEDCFEKANSITPVPGGVGPMTITMLLSNTVASAQNKI